MVESELTKYYFLNVAEIVVHNDNLNTDNIFS